jgi:hypothetical protein
MRRKKLSTTNLTPLQKTPKILLLKNQGPIKPTNHKKDLQKAYKRPCARPQKSLIFAHQDTQRKDNDFTA